MNKINTELVFQWFGNGWALGAYGKKDDIEVTFNGLYNHRGHDDEVVYLSDGFGYVLTDKEKLIQGFSNLLMQDEIDVLHVLPRGKERKQKLASARKKCDTQAAVIVESIKIENFLQGASDAVEYQAPFSKNQPTFI